MFFNNTFAFFLLALIPIYFVLKKTKIFEKNSFPLAIFDWGGKAGGDFSKNFRLPTVLSVFSSFLELLFFVALVFAFSDPVKHTEEKIFSSKGTQILFVLDTSLSMAAKDISVVNGLKTEQISRFEAARQGIRTLVSSSQGMSFGLVAMAKEAAVLVPPTEDFDFFAKQLDSISVGEFGDGTAIGIGLSSAVFHLASSNSPKKVVVLITDGENNAGAVHPETAASLARDNGIAVYTIGIGTRGTVPVEYVNPETGKIVSGFYESEFDSSELEKIALFTDGQYFGLENFSALAESLSLVSKKESVVQQFHIRTVDILYFKRFLLFAIALFVVSSGIKNVVLREIF